MQSVLECEHATLSKDEIDVALLFATCYGEKECARLLLEAGAVVNAAQGLFKTYGDTMAIVVSSGEYYKDYWNGYRNYLNVLYVPKWHPNDDGIFYRTPLIAACESDDVEFVQLLLQYVQYNSPEKVVGCREDSLDKVVDCQDDSLDTFQVSSEPSRQSTALSESSFSNAKTMIDLEHETTPLITAVMIENLDIVKLLLNEKFPVDEEDFEGRIPLDYAIEGGCPDMLEILLAAGADVNAGCDRWKQYIPLLTACSAKNNQAIRLLLRYGAKVPVPKKYRGNVECFLPSCVLCEASTFASGEVIGLLCQSVDDLDHYNCAFSPLTKAVRKRNINAARILVQYGCTLDSPGKVRLVGWKDIKLLQMTLKKKHLDLFKMLYMAGAFTLQNLHEVYNDGSLHDVLSKTPEMKAMLVMYACNPPSLYHICRQAIRAAIQKPLPHSVPRLNLPPAINGFLLYNDI